MGDSTLNFCLHFRPGFVENLGFLHSVSVEMTGRQDRPAESYLLPMVSNAAGAEILRSSMLNESQHFTHDRQAAPL